MFLLRGAGPRRWRLLEGPTSVSWFECGWDEVEVEVEAEAEAEAEPDA